MKDFLKWMLFGWAMSTLAIYAFAEDSQPTSAPVADPVEVIVVDVATKTRDEPNMFDKVIAKLSETLPPDMFKAYTLEYQANKIGPDIVTQFTNAYRNSEGNAYAMRKAADYLLTQEIAEVQAKVDALVEARDQVRFVDMAPASQP